MADLTELVMRRGVIKSQLSRFEAFVGNIKDDQIIELPLRKKKCEEDWVNFAEIQVNIEMLDNSNKQLKERVSFEDRYFKIMALVDSKLHSDLNSSNSVNTSVSHLSNSQAGTVHQTDRNIKLPAMEIPSFSGSYLGWSEFHDTFKILVHTNQELSDVQKFYYLKRALKGDAAEVLGALEVSEQNYNEAWDLLQSRYENKKQIAISHFDSLLNYPLLGKESSIQIRKFVDTIRRDLRALKSLKQPVESWDNLLIYILEGKLDQSTKNEWKRLGSSSVFSTMKEFLDFLEKRWRDLEPSYDSSKNSGKCAENRAQTDRRTFVKNTYFTTSNACTICGRQHYLFECKGFHNMSMLDRRNEVKRSNACWNCLKWNHRVENCTMSGCSTCGRKHNILLHFSGSIGRNNSDSANRNGTVNGMPQTTNNTINRSNTVGNNNNNRGSTVNSAENSGNNSNENLRAQRDTGASQSGEQVVHTYKSVRVSDNADLREVLLSTAQVQVVGKSGNLIECRALLDSASQSNFISKELWEKTGLKSFKVNIPVQGIGQGCINIRDSVNLNVRSKYNNFQTEGCFLVIDEISSGLPSYNIDSNVFQIPENINLADTAFCKTNKIDLLLGATVFWDLLCIGQFKLNKDGPFIQKTKLGWIISGTIPGVKTQNKKRNCNFSENKNIEAQLERFWTLDECREASPYTGEEEKCQELFEKSTERNSEGRFIVKYPFRDNVEKLGQSYNTALKRFNYLEKKLERDTDMKQQYHDFMREYIQLGHMSKVGNDNQASNFTHYLCHHGVFKDSSVTTKCRVVFDGSADTDSGISLNDTLLTGPKLQDNLFNILVRFREHTVVILADVAKMYRQILIYDKHREFQRILWRFSVQDEIETYRLNTVTYGLAPSSFLAVRCLMQLAIEAKDKYQKASDIITRDFYMDDLITGANTVDEARKLKTEISDILNSGCFPLRKWKSNHPEVLMDEPDATRDIEHYLAEDDVNKTLGLLWNSGEDFLHFCITIDTRENKATKRGILSVIAQIFDPLGLVGPVIIKAKLVIQALWQMKLGWDESLPQELHSSWIKLRDKLKTLEELKINRKIVCEGPVNVQLHCFTDSSETAYGAAIYIRSTDASGNHNVNLVCSKSRVAPLKSVSLPRLELCAALLGAKLTEEVINSLNFNFNKIKFWTDSTITLAWIRGEPCQWKTFIANRVGEIQRLTDLNSWGHIISESNPADVLSRGIEPDIFKDFSLWWEGPSFLRLSEELWPRTESNSVILEELPEVRKQKLVFSAIVSHDIFEKYSSLKRLKYVVSWIFRFYNNCKLKGEKRVLGKCLSSNEQENALKRLIILSQKQSFPEDWQALKNSKMVSNSSKIISLNPFLDESGLIRVGGRIQGAEIGYDQKHPIILPKTHKLTKLIILSEHYRNMHAGAQTLLSIVRLVYWPLSGRSVVRDILRKCVTCFRAKPLPVKHIMGNLPSSRITPSKPFERCGVDYAGPFHIKAHKVRGQKLIKGYLCVFVCLVTKACHLELVNDLTTEAFLNCFKRFIARRGLPRDIYSDNGSNFIGANNQLQDLFVFLGNKENQCAFAKYFSDFCINWHFIPAHSPHFGGLWEAAVKSAKHHLKRVVGEISLTYDELNTVITQAEACLNSRPLTPLSEDPTDFNVLTPGHFLIGCPLVALPQENIKDLNPGRIQRFQLVTQMMQHFWSQWSRSYLSNLQERRKWRSSAELIEPGQMVILEEKGVPPLKWPLARVMEVHPGKDGVVRVVTLKMSNGHLVKRAVAKMCVLPVSN